MNTATRAEHLEWCKKRARDNLRLGEIQNAFTSMCSDLGKHPETEKHIGIGIGMMLLMCGNLKTEAEMRRFVEGFN